MYKYYLSKQVEKFLAKQEKKFLETFLEKASELSISPYKNTLDIKALKWQRSKYRLRISKYRFLYEISDEKISIYFSEAGSRWDIYK